MGEVSSTACQIVTSASREHQRALPEGAHRGSSKEPSQGSFSNARLHALLASHHAFVWRSLRRLGVPDGDVDDASQQVFLVAHRRLAQIAPESERSFLFQTAAMVYARPYLASILCYSGGAMTLGTLPDPKNHPAMLGAHGAVGSDVFGIDIAVNTILLENDLKSKGSFVIDCDDGGDHQGIGTRMAGAAGPGWQFFKDHPYEVDPEPYRSVPSTFPAYCKLM